MSRYTIEFSKEADDGLQEAQKVFGTATKADLIRKAINLVSYIAKERKKGGRLIVENDQEHTRKEIVTL